MATKLSRTSSPVEATLSFMSDNGKSSFFAIFLPARNALAS